MLFSTATTIASTFLFLGVSIQGALCQLDQMRDSCGSYLLCRHELEYKYWRCSKKARISSQHTCKSEQFLRGFYDNIVHREKYLYRCYSKEKYSSYQHKNCQLTETWVSSDNCSTEAFTKHQLGCRKLRECCPQINSCLHKEYFKLLTKHLKEMRENTLKALYTCTSGLSKVISANISSEDTQIAVDVLKFNEIVIATVTKMGFLKRKKISNKSNGDPVKIGELKDVSKMKVFGTPLLSGNSYIHELNNGTALLTRLESDLVGTKKQTSKDIPRSYRHRSQTIKNYPLKPDRIINYNNQNRLYGQSRKLHQLSNSSILNRPFTIRRPWSSDRKVATKRKIGTIRTLRTIHSISLPVKAKHELKIRPLPIIENLHKRLMNTTDRNEKQLLKPVYLRRYNVVERQIINVLSTTERLPHTSTVYSEESEEDFTSSLQRTSSSLVQFGKNAIPLPMRNSVDSGGTGPNDLENEMEVVVDGGTWTMIPKTSTTHSPTKGNPLENFVEQEKMSAADISDLSTQLPLLIEYDKLKRVHVLPKVDMLEGEKIKFSTPQMTDNFWSRSRNYQVFGNRLHLTQILPTAAELIAILRNPKNKSHCDLTKMCRQLYSQEKSNCAATSVDSGLPGVPKSLRFSKCITLLTPQFEKLRKIIENLESSKERCLLARNGDTVSVCSSHVPQLPNFEHLLECSNRVLFLNLHCEKLSSCCSSSSECHKMINSSKAYEEMRSKKQELLRKSHKCQTKSMRKFNLSRKNAKL